MRIFVTGIGTEIGKTISSAIICKALDAEYFKPIQAGDLDFTDADKVNSYQSDNHVNHGIGIRLTQPMSPHAAAEIDGVQIKSNEVPFPKTENLLVVEGAGGLLVPISKEETIADLIQPDDKVILISRHYLGSINHTLLSAEWAKSKSLDTAIIFVGEETVTSESIISKMSQLPVIGRIDLADEITEAFVSEQAEKLKFELKKFIHG